MKTTFRIFIIAVVAISFFVSCGSGGSGENILETIKLFPVKIEDGYHAKYCYVDKTGKVVIDGGYDDASLFYDGIAGVYTREGAGSWGLQYINEKGEVIIPDVFAKGTPFSEGIAFVKVGTRICDRSIAIAINTKGEQLFKLNTEETGVFREGLAAFESIETGDWGFVNKKGEIVISPTLRLSFYTHFSQGKIFVCGDNHKWGVINAKGDQIIDFLYERPSEFDVNDQAAVKCEGGGYAIIDKKGDYILPPQSKYMIESDGGLYRIQSGRNRIGWMDKNGKVIIEPVYESRGTDYFSGTDLVFTVRSISDSPSSYVQEYGYINRKGEMVLKCKRSDFNSPFMGDIAIMGGRNFCFINKRGERVSNLFYGIGSLGMLGKTSINDGRYSRYRW